MMSQLQLFTTLSFNNLRQVKESMAGAAKECGLSREQICDGMNDLAERYGIKLASGNGGRLSVTTLEKWLNPEESKHLPSYKALPIFCAIVDSVAPFRVMLEPLGCMVIDSKDAKLLRWAKHFHKVKEERKRMKEIEAEL